MTVVTVSEHEIYHNIGLSTDTKPNGQTALSTYYAYDTFVPYVTYDGTNWVEDRRLSGGERNVIDYATLTVSSTGIGLSSASPAIGAGATVRRAVITVEDDQVRYREDGTDPTSSEGTLLEVGDVLSYTNANYETILNQVKFIRVTGDAKLKIHYYD